MDVVHKDNKKVYKVYDITYDSSGYPHFLIYFNRQWMRVSAKHFEPYVDETMKVLDEYLNTHYGKVCEVRGGFCDKC